MPFKILINSIFEFKKFIFLLFKISLALFIYIGARCHTLMSETHHYFLGAFTTFSVSLYYLYIAIQSLDQNKK